MYRSLVGYLFRDTPILQKKNQQRRKAKLHPDCTPYALGVEGVNRQEIEETIREYSWMVREIGRLADLLGDAGERLVRDYSSMGLPKPKGLPSDPVAFEAMRREKDLNKLKRYVERVRYIQDRIELIQDQKERTVLDCLLDGMSLTAIAHHLGLSPTQVYRIKESVITTLIEKAPA